MGNTLSRDGQNYRWDSLFQALTRPDDLRDYLERMGPSHGPLRTQIDLLTGTLQVDLSLLKVSEVAESFDTATFCLGQLVSHEPLMVSELPFALTFVEGLSSALRKGWLVHHGVGKFAANALTILCICEQANSAVRDRAIEELLGGLLEWLRSEDAPTDVDEVCGCNCGCPALSATCWLERLLSKPDALLEEKVGSWPALWPLVTALLDVVCRRDGNPFALTRLLRVPKVFSSLMKHDEQTAQTALDFLTFGVLQFENPMFTEDAVQALLALLREPGASGVQAVLKGRCSLLLLEALATAACYLPSAMTALEILASEPDGKACLYSLAEKLGEEKEAASSSPSAAAAAAPSASDAASSKDGENGSGAASSNGHHHHTNGEKENGHSHSNGHNGAVAASPAAAATATTTAIPPASPASSATSGKEGSPSFPPTRSSPVPPNTSSNGPIPPTPRSRASSPRLQGSGLLTSVLNRVTAGWLPRRRQSRLAVFSVHPADPSSSRSSEQQQQQPASPNGEGGSSKDASAASSTSAMNGDASSNGHTNGHANGLGVSYMQANGHKGGGSGGDDDDDDDSTREYSEDEEEPQTPSSTPAGSRTAPFDAAIDGNAGASSANGVTTTATTPTGNGGLDRPLEPEAGGVEAWDQFREDLPKTTAFTLALHIQSHNNNGNGKQPANPDSPSVVIITNTDSDNSDDDGPTKWPTKVAADVVKAWVLLEVAGFQQGQEAELLARMSLSDKRVWLSRRLYREHHGSRVTEEDPILFVEATRDEPKEVLTQIRAQYDDGVGLAGDLSATLEVTFKDENSAGSAVRREWFALVSEAFLAQDANILTSTDKGLTVRPMPMLSTDDNASSQLRDLEMLGRFLGLALVQQVTVAVRLHPSVCKLLLNLGEPYEWTYEDIEELDALLYAHKVKYILENEVEPLCLDFTDVLHDGQPPAAGAATNADSDSSAAEKAAPEPPAEPVRVELLPNGESIEVTEANKHEFVKLVCEWRLFGSIKPQVDALLRGLEAAVPRHILSQLAQLIGPTDLARMLAGEAEIDVHDWEKNSVTSGGMRRGGRTFRWFWRAVRSFTPHEREQLLQFVTGSRRPPVGGFAQLQGFNGGVHLFTLSASHEPKDSLPRAHACICTVDVPEYSSYKSLRRALHTSATLGSIGFDDAAVTADGGDDVDEVPPTPRA